MEEPSKKGTVTPISSLFSPEETLKAAERVREKIAESSKQLGVLKGFISDNTNLINLVQTLPSELEHQIMVPWGKAAFFPGRLIHTNEFMVLLGDGYYAERTSKQTVEILKRRQKVLECQVESAKADIQDLKTEASFFYSTADEATSGLVQIVEDYAEERLDNEASDSDQFPRSSSAEPERTMNEDDEYERIFTSLDEMEKEEEAAETGGEDEFTSSILGSLCDFHLQDEFSRSSSAKQERTIEEVAEYERIFARIAELEMEEEADKNGDENESNEEEFGYSDENESNEQQSSGDEVVRRSAANGLEQLSVFKEAGVPAASNKSRFFKNAFPPSETKQKFQAPPVAKPEASDTPVQTSTSSSKAFTGSIVERARNLETKPREMDVADSSKRVSRFRMNRK